MSIKTNKEEEKTLEKAQKDAEMVSEFAKDARNRKDAKAVSDKLESEIEVKDGQHAIEDILDETKDNIRLTAKTAAKELPQYTQMIGDIQEETVKVM